jgi:hypothetical protein
MVNTKYKLIGQTFFDWTVISGPFPRKSQDSKWGCRCVCGTEKMVEGYYLRKGKSKGCGCRKSERLREAKRLSPGESGMNQLYLKYQIEARNRGLCWELSREEFKQLTQQNCHYCGSPPSKFYQNNGSKSVEAKEYSRYLYNGIDRRDNLLGYKSANTTPCCWRCNKMKGSIEYSQFLRAVEDIYKNRKEGFL